MPWSKFSALQIIFPIGSYYGRRFELFPTSRGIPRRVTQINLNQAWMQRFHEKLPQVYASKY